MSEFTETTRAGVTWRSMKPTTPLALIESLPDSIRVGPFVFKIELWTNNQALGAARWGEFSSIEQTLRFQRDYATAHQVVDIVLHELGHAIWWACAIEDKDDQERTVGMLATGWHGVYRDNPWLLDWLKRTLAA